MICSFIVGLRPKEEGQNKRYMNFDYLKPYFEEKLTAEEMKKIRVSNFLTRDRILEEKTYKIKISSIDSKVTTKVMEILFYKKLLNSPLRFAATEFYITNIYHNNFWSRQLDLEEFLEAYEEMQPKNRGRLKLLTPTFFKVGSQYVASVEPIYVFKDLVRKLKKSSLLEEELLQDIKNFDVKKLKIVENLTECRAITQYRTDGLVGEVEYSLEEYSEEDLRVFHFLLEFAFFSGIGYQTERGYGQAMEEEGVTER